MFKWILNLLDKALSFRYRNVAYVNGTLQSATELGAELERRLAAPIYTTIRGFAGPDGQQKFWPWVKSVISEDEYRYMIFVIRENVIRDLTGATDPSVIARLSARIEMLWIIDQFLHQGVSAYESQIQRDQEI